MDKNIFREKSVDNISSPDSLNDYIRVVSPSVWATIAAIIVLLLGFTIWGVLGSLDTVINAVVVSENGNVTAYINETDSSSVLTKNIITISGQDYSYNPDESIGKKLNMGDDETLITMLGGSDNTRIRCFAVEGDIPEGVYNGSIVVDSVKPMSFIIN